MTYVGPTVFGAPQRPYQNSPWGTLLADNAAIDPNSSAVVASLATQAVAPNAQPNINLDPKWTAEPMVVPASQPLVPVTVSGQISQIVAIAVTGLPIPASYVPSGGDGIGIFWQPDYQSPNTSLPGGRYYEASSLRYTNGVDSSGGWTASNVARAVSVNTDTGGHFGNWTASGYRWGTPGDPDSTYELAGFGVAGSGLPIMPGVISAEDCRRGYIDHAIQLIVAHAAPGHVGMAQKDDGDDPSTLVVEGQHYRLAAGYTTGGVHWICEMIIAAVARYGLVVSDKSAYKGQNGNLAFRAAPSAAPFFSGLSGSAVLTGFPWSHLKLLA